MATRGRDLYRHASSRSERNKENLPVSSSPAPSIAPSHRLRPSYVPSLTKTPDHREFFTDSFIDNTSHSSLSASPVPTLKSSLPRPKPVGTARVQQRPQHRQTRSELPGSPGIEVRRVYSKPLACGTSPIRSEKPATPLRSREGSFSSAIGSPDGHAVSSPPPALTETYSRITQEEDLAATEGEISDPESPIQQSRELVRRNGHIAAKSTSVESLRQLSRTLVRTPTNDRPGSLKPANDDLTSASIVSDPMEQRSHRSGMSFVDQFTDPGLRLVMTPHFESKLEDQRALDKVWAGRRPIAFSKAQNVLLEPEAVAEAVSDAPRILPPRLTAFGKAKRIKLASDDQFPALHHRTLSDDAIVVDPRFHDIQSRSEKDNQLRKDALPTNPRLHREPYFAKNHGFPERTNGQLESHDEDEASWKAQSESPQISNSNMLDGAFRQSLRTLSSRRSHFAPATRSVEDLGARSDAASDASTDIWAPQRHARTSQVSQPISRARSESQYSDTQDLQTSPEKSRRLDFDFTGQSFQVSDSPPVRAKGTAQDFAKSREIQGLAKQAVTTSRLSQLRARESLEKMRQSSRSPISDVGTADSAQDGNGHTTPSNSAQIYRTLSNGSAKNKPAESPSGHDILQRLARSSSTPRSSTSSEQTINGDVQGDRQSRDRATPARAPNTEEENMLHRTVSGPTMAATPKVTGAWTDTILPDTVKTVKQANNKSRYAQTPHVSAGGWVDTPATNGRLEPLLEDSREVPEELLNGIGKDSASDRTVLAGGPQSQATASLAQETIARNILNEARDKRVQDQADDSLFLGNTTIQSLENVLDQEETDMTIRSQLPQTDTEVLDRLGTKLDRLRTHIHDARQGISNLEHQIATETPMVATTSTTDKASTSLPFALLTVRLPIPMLFRAQRDSRLPKPTPLGWCVLLFLSWYILENLFAELFAHPLYASSYTWPDLPEPEFPFVLPTMLLRWCRMEFLGPWIVTLVRRLFMALLRVIGILLGLVDRQVDSGIGMGEPNGLSMDTGMASEHAGFDMMHDEVL